MEFPHASLDDLRSAIRMRRIIAFRHWKEPTTFEPHVLARSLTLGSYVVGGWIIERDEFSFIRCPEMREIEVTFEHFSRIRPEYDPYDRSMGFVDTCIHFPSRGREAGV